MSLQEPESKSTETLRLDDILHTKERSGWIAAQKAITELRVRLPGRDAESLIGSWVQDGRLRVFAERVLETRDTFRASVHLTETRSRTELIPASSTIRDQQNVQLEPEFWAASENFGQDLRQWQWASGNFTITLPTEEAGVVHQRKVQGAHFKIEDIQRLTPKLKSPTRDRQKDEHWAAFIAELALAAWQKDINLGQNADELLVHIESRLHHRLGPRCRIPSRTVAYAALQATLRLILAGNADPKQ